MGGNAVKGLFIALSTEKKTLFHPMAEFHPGMFADDCVMLSFEDFL
jgi:hypothetical protein